MNRFVHSVLGVTLITVVFGCTRTDDTDFQVIFKSGRKVSIPKELDDSGYENKIFEFNGVWEGQQLENEELYCSVDIKKKITFYRFAVFASKNCKYESAEDNCRLILGQFDVEKKKLDYQVLKEAVIWTYHFHKDSYVEGLAATKFKKKPIKGDYIPGVWGQEVEMSPGVQQDIMDKGDFVPGVWGDQIQHSPEVQQEIMHNGDYIPGVWGHKIGHSPHAHSGFEPTIEPPEPAFANQPSPFSNQGTNQPFGGGLADYGAGLQNNNPGANFHQHHFEPPEPPSHNFDHSPASGSPFQDAPSPAWQDDRRGGGSIGGGSSFGKSLAHHGASSPMGGGGNMGGGSPFGSTGGNTLRNLAKGLGGPSAGGGGLGGGGMRGGPAGGQGGGGFSTGGGSALQNLAKGLK